MRVFVGTILNYFECAGVVHALAAAADLSVGDQYLVIGKTTGVVGGRVEQLRLCEGETMRVSPTGVSGSLIYVSPPGQGSTWRQALQAATGGRLGYH